MQGQLLESTRSKLARLIEKIVEALKGLGVLVLLVFGAVILYLFDWDTFSKQITEYPVQCNVPLVNGECSQPGYALNPTVYVINVDQQFVVSHVDGFSPDRI